MRNRRLAANYASALLSLLTDETEAGRAEEFLDGLADAMDRSPEFRDLLRDPSIAKEARRDVVLALAERHEAPRHVRNFLGVIADHNRTGVIDEIAAEFKLARETRMGVVPVELTTARPLSDELRDRAAAALRDRTGKQVRLRCKVDESLIGGAIARVGSRVYDGSLKTQLHHLRERMVQG